MGGIDAVGEGRRAMSAGGGFWRRLAQPTQFLVIADALRPWFAGAAALLLAAGLYFALFDSPPDYQQGETVRIMYVHVPAAWLALFGYTAMAVASLAALIWRSPVSEAAAQSAAPIGAVFTVLCLVTGSLWGKPMWGAWWVWDARLTSMLVLFFLYIGYIALTNAFDDPDRGVKAGTILALVGFIDVPVVKFSVDWWNTLHQPASVSKAAAPSVAPEMLLPLLLMALGFQALFGWLMLVRMKATLLERRVRALEAAAIQG